MRLCHSLLLTPMLLAACGSGLEKLARPAEELASADVVVRELLDQSADRAANRLGSPDGFWADPRVRIGLPEELARLEKGLRRLGLERYSDEFRESLNRAAEQAMPAVKPVVLRMVRDMTLADAVAIVRGDEDAASRYFRMHAEASLREQLKPIVAEATGRGGVTAAYKRLLKRAVFLEKIAEPDELDLDGYVTRAALDGLFLVMTEEERRIRRDPRARTSELLRKAFR